MSGIDWEDILGAEGADMQDAYDDLVDRAGRQMARYDSEQADWDEVYAAYEEEEARKRAAHERWVTAQEQRRHYSVALWRPAHELEALRQQMEKFFHLKLHWDYDCEGRMMALRDAQGCSIELANVDSRWCLVFSSQVGYWNLDEPCFDEDLQTIENEDVYPGETDGEYAEWTYDREGLPLNLVRENGEDVWSRSEHHDDEITWVYDVYVSFCGTEFRLKEMWCDHTLIWLSSAQDEQEEDFFDLSRLMWYTPPAPPLTSEEPGSWKFDGDDEEEYPF